MSQGRRTKPLPPRWATHIRPYILARDNNTCQQCGNPGHHVDHIVPASQNGTDHTTNLQTLCAPCHATKTAYEANQAKPKRKRPTPPHPGTIKN